MGLKEERADAEVEGRWKDMFLLSRDILNWKDSKGLMMIEIDNCLYAMGNLAMENIGDTEHKVFSEPPLPSGFYGLSVYGQREAINKIKIMEWI